MDFFSFLLYKTQQICQPVAEGGFMVGNNLAGSLCNKSPFCELC